MKSIFKSYCSYIIVQLGISIPIIFIIYQIFWWIKIIDIGYIFIHVFDYIVIFTFLWWEINIHWKVGFPWCKHVHVKRIKIILSLEIVMMHWNFFKNNFTIWFFVEPLTLLVVFETETSLEVKPLRLILSSFEDEPVAYQ